MMRGSLTPIHKSENPGVVEISRWVHELGVIEYIERFCAKLHLHTFCDLRIFQQSHIESCRYPAR